MNLSIHKSYLSIVLITIFFLISIRCISEPSSTNDEHESNNIIIELDAFDIYQNGTCQIYSLGKRVMHYNENLRTYSISAGNRKGIWMIDENTGELLLIDPKSLNNTANFEYPLLIEARDKESQQLLFTEKISITVRIKNLDNYFENFGLPVSETIEIESEQKTFNILHRSLRDDITF